MKKNYKFAAIFTWLVTVLSFVEMTAQTTPLFRKNVYKTDGAMTFRKGVETPDKGYLLVGDLADATDESIIVVKMDANGTIQWSKRYATDSAAYSADIVPMPNGNYLICGDRYTNGTSDMITFRINPQGNLVSPTGTFFTGSGALNDDELTYSATRIGSATNPRYAISGASYSEDVSSNALSAGVVVFLDSAGMIDDYRCINSTLGGAFNGFISSDRMPDGGAILGGFTARGFTFDPYFTRLNADGSTRWVKRLNALVGAQLTAQVKALPDGGFMAASSATNAAANTDNPWVARFNASGNMMWFKLLENSVFSRPYNLSIISDSTVLVYGHYNASANPTGGKFVPFFTKMSLSNGAIRWTKSYSSDTAFAERATHMIPMSSGAITTLSEKIIVLPTDTLLGTQFLRTDFQGNLPNCINKTFAPIAGASLPFQDSTRFVENAGGSFGTITVRSSTVVLDVQNLCTATNTEEVLAETAALRVFPNPAKSGQSLTIDLEKWDGEATVELLDMTGRRLQMQRIFSKTVNLDTPPVSSGFYMVKVQTSHQILTKKIVIE